MKVTIRLLGQARQLAASDHLEIDLPAGAAAHDALPAVLHNADPRLVTLLADESGKLRRSVMAVLNDKVIDPAEPGLLQNDDELSLLPPMSGG